MSVKIGTLQIENVKRIKAVTLAPSQNGLTIIGGDNGQGKTSVLDSIAWALGGDRFRPSQAEREGSVVPPSLRVTLSNGLVVERNGKNSTLKVTDPEGVKGGQMLLDSFVEVLAINLPKFLNSTSREKAQYLLQIIGIGDELTRLDMKENELYNQRRVVGQMADQKAKYAKEMVFFENVPDEPVSVADLIRQQQDILAKNGENARKRELVKCFEDEELKLLNHIEGLKQQLESAQQNLMQVQENLRIARMDALDLEDMSTAEIEQSITDIENINAKVRANCDRQRAEIEAEGLHKQYDDLTAEIENIRKTKIDLLSGVKLPLDGLSVQDGELTYNGFKWDNMSSSDQLKVATAITKALKPECGFILLDKLEQMDMNTLNEFGTWLEQQGLQAIATRVSRGDECSVIIEDGYSKEQSKLQASEKTWNAGEF